MRLAAPSAPARGRARRRPARRRPGMDNPGAAFALAGAVATNASTTEPGSAASAERPPSSA